MTARGRTHAFHCRWTVCLSLLLGLSLEAAAGSSILAELRTEDRLKLSSKLISELAEEKGSQPARELLVTLKHQLPPFQSTSRMRYEQNQSARAAIQKSRTEFLKHWASDELKLIRSYQTLPLIKIRLDSDRQLIRLAALEAVMAISLDEPIFANLNQSLPLTHQQDTIIAGLTASGQTIAIVDTGLDYTREAFGYCSSPGVPQSCRVRAAVEIASEDYQLDTQGHGTFVSAIVADSAPGSQLIGLDIFDGSQAATSDLLLAIEWIVANRDTYNITVANFSLGGATPYYSPCDSFLNPHRTAFATLVANDIVPVVASGNNGFSNALVSPACLSDSIAVGAVYDANVGSRSWSACSDTTTATDQIACFSNGASFLDLLAPGAMILAGGYQGGGTSMAAPHVAAAASMLRARDPSKSVVEIRAALNTSPTQITDNRNGFSHPRLDMRGPLTPFHDDFAQAQLLSSDSGQISGTTLFTVVETDEPGSQEQSQWFRFAPAMSATYSFSLIADSELVSVNIYRIDDEGFEGLNFVTLVEAGSTTQISLDAQSQYAIQLGSSASASHSDFTLSYEPIPADTTPPQFEEIPFLPVWLYPVFAGFLLFVNKVRHRNLS